MHRPPIIETPVEHSNTEHTTHLLAVRPNSLASFEITELSVAYRGGTHPYRRPSHKASRIQNTVKELRLLPSPAASPETQSPDAMSARVWGAHTSKFGLATRTERSYASLLFVPLNFADSQHCLVIVMNGIGEASMCAKYMV